MILGRGAEVKKTLKTNKPTRDSTKKIRREGHYSVKKTLPRTHAGTRKRQPPDREGVQRKKGTGLGKVPIRCGSNNRKGSQVEGITAARQRQEKRIRERSGMWKRAKMGSMTKKKEKRKKKKQECP